MTWPPTPLTIRAGLTPPPCLVPAVDEMGHRIDELEGSIGELMAQAGIDEEPVAEGEAGSAGSAAAQPAAPAS